LSYTYLGYNLRNELFQDVKVRQAITHALDRDAMIAAVLDGDGQVAHAPASPLSWAYNPDTPKFEYDPEKAKQMLAEAGWEPGPDGILQKDGQRFSFTIKTNQGNKIREDLTVVIQQQLREVGIEATPQIVEFSALIDQINPPNRDFDAIVIGWSLSTDPDPTSIWHSKEIELGNNMIAYSRPDLDELMDINTEIVDLEERQQVIWQIFDEIANDQPYTFLYYPNSHRAMPTDLEGFIHHPRVEQYLAHKWWLDR
jgi:peptide/nickel transport system substrate-binding protein